MIVLRINSHPSWVARGLDATPLTRSAAVPLSAKSKKGPSPSLLALSSSYTAPLMYSLTQQFRA